MIFPWYLFSSCHPDSAHSDKSLALSSSSSIKIEQGSSCHGETSVDFDLIKSRISYSGSKPPKVQDHFLDSLKSVPEEILAQFSSFGGNVSFKKSLRSTCQIGGETITAYACWEVHKDGSKPTLYVKDSFEPEDKETYEKAIINTFALMYYDYLSQYELIDGELVEKFDEDEMIKRFLEAKFFSETLGLKTSLGSITDTLAFIMTEARCNHESADKLFKALSLDEEGEESGDFALSLSGGKGSLDLGKSQGASVKAHFETLNMKVKKKIKNNQALPASRLSEVGKNLLGKKERASYESFYAERGLEKWSESMGKEGIEKKGGLKVYTGVPRLVRGSSNTVLKNRQTWANPEGKPPITIMIHGTFSASALKKGGWGDVESGMMADSLRLHYGGDVLAFQWSGQNLKGKRTEAADALRDHVKELQKRGFNVNLVGHSHGATVAIEAINGLDSTIGELVTLARPVRYSYRLQDLNRVSHYTEAYGTLDPVQLAGGIDDKGRTLAEVTDPMAESHIRIKNGTHSDVKKMLHHVLESSAAHRKGLLEKTEEAHKVCGGKCFLAATIGVVGAAAFVGIGVGVNGSKD